MELFIYLSLCFWMSLCVNITLYCRVFYVKNVPFFRIIYRECRAYLDLTVYGQYNLNKIYLFL